MKKLILIGIIILMVIPGAFAQFRIDLAIDVPVKLGVSVSDLNGGSANESVDVLEFGTFPIPEALFAYQTSLLMQELEEEVLCYLDFIIM